MNFLLLVLRKMYGEIVTKLSRKIQPVIASELKSELWHVRKIMNESFGIILMFFNFFLCMYLKYRISKGRQLCLGIKYGFEFRIFIMI